MSFSPRFFAAATTASAVLVIDVDHRGAAVDHQRLEQPQLGREIGLHASDDSRGGRG